MTNVVSITLAILLQVESSGMENPPDGDNGVAVGVLQMHKCMVDEVNRLFHTAYTYEDRRDPDKSIAMARMWLGWAAKHHRIGLPHKLAARWNQPTTGRVAPEYRHRVMVCWCENRKARSKT